MRKLEIIECPVYRRETISNERHKIRSTVRQYSIGFRIYHEFQKNILAMLSRMYMYVYSFRIRRIDHPWRREPRRRYCVVLNNEKLRQRIKKSIKVDNLMACISIGRDLCVRFEPFSWIQWFTLWQNYTVCIESGIGRTDIMLNVNVENW